MGGKWRVERGRGREETKRDKEEERGRGREEEKRE